LFSENNCCFLKTTVVFKKQHHDNMLSWCCRGVVVVLSWCCRGVVVVPAWRCRGVVVVLLWRYPRSSSSSFLRPSAGSRYSPASFRYTSALHRYHVTRFSGPPLLTLCICWCTLFILYICLRTSGLPLCDIVHVFTYERGPAI